MNELKLYPVKIKTKAYFIFFCSMILSLSHAQDGSNDPTFNPNDDGTYFGSGFNNSVYALSLQADGKIIVGGSFNNFNSLSWSKIARLDSDGYADPSFNIGTGFNLIVYSIGIQSDGKYIVGGGFDSFNGEYCPSIARLNSDGSFDTSFNIYTGFNNTVRSIQLDDNDRIIAGGNFTSYNDTIINRVIRLNSDGSIDNSFNPQLGFNNDVASIVIDDNGKIVVGGRFTSFNGTPVNRIARLNPDGSLDNTFDSGSGFDSGVVDISLQPDGKILVGGVFSEFNGLSANKIIRLNPDGSKDNSFNINSGFNNEVYTIAIQADDKIVVGGAFTEYGGTNTGRIIRLNSNGERDLSFDPGLGFDNYVNCMLIQEDNKIVIGGEFYEFDGIHRNHIARLTVTSVGTKLLQKEDLIKAYPNPTNSDVEIHVPSEYIGDELLITNVFGEVIDQKHLNTSFININLNSEANGIYFIRINSKEGTLTTRVIKH